MRFRFYIGVLLILTGIIFGLINYILHMPNYRPDWFDMYSMMRLIELNILFSVAGTVVISYTYLKLTSEE